MLRYYNVKQAVCSHEGGKASLYPQLLTNIELLQRAHPQRFVVAPLYSPAKCLTIFS